MLRTEQSALTPAPANVVLKTAARAGSVITGDPSFDVNERCKKPGGGRVHGVEEPTAMLASIERFIARC